ncbi:MBL fold metallo-hydrolase [Streptomyces griseorubiginosus]|uniref:MBL fold metallo-hydrolase n=1 Tax=Streptomyces griseorubiginosus TaxID=67304 RepID=UPI001FCC3C59|nr:MBL fold metallo-hydrolase [Streptomyces griseorubiginosus]
MTAAVPAAASLTAGLLSGTAEAAATPDLPDFAPVPAGSLGPALNGQGYYVGPIADGLYWVTDGSYQAMFLATREGVVLVDAPPTLGHNLIRAIEQVTRPIGLPSKVTHLVYSHSHADHIGAAGLWGKDVERIGHAENRRLLKRDADPGRPAPATVFEDRLVVEVGGERLELSHHGANHAPDNIFIRAPRQRTLMVVDVFYPGWVPFSNLAVSQEIPGWVRAHDIALGYRWQTLVAGHLGRLGHRGDAEVQRQYIADLYAGARAAIAGLDPTPFFAKYGPGGNAWAVFKTYLRAAAERAAGPVTDKYLGVLAAADVFTVDNAFTVVESLRIDDDVLGPFAIHP